MVLWNEYIGEFDKQFEGKCYIEYCGNKIQRDKFHIGHVKPFSKGGSDQLSNLRPICSHCNLAMQTQDLYEFKESLKKLKM